MVGPAVSRVVAERPLAAGGARSTGSTRRSGAYGSGGSAQPGRRGSAGPRRPPGPCSERPRPYDEVQPGGPADPAAVREQPQGHATTVIRSGSELPCFGGGTPVSRAFVAARPPRGPGRPQQRVAGPAERA